MTNRILTCAIALLLTSAAVTRAQDVQDPVRVFVTADAHPTLDTRTPEERKAAVDDAKGKLATLEQSLKSQFGKKREAWPKDAQDRFWHAKDMAALAGVAEDYAVRDEAAVDSIEDIIRALGGTGLAGRRKHVQVVTSAAEAQLIVEIKDRRSAIGVGTLLNMVANKRRYVLYAIKAGPQITADQFAAIPQSFERQRIARPRPDAPEWLFESMGSTSWKNAGAIAASTIDSFAKASHTSLIPAVAAQ